MALTSSISQAFGKPCAEFALALFGTLVGIAVAAFLTDSGKLQAKSLLIVAPFAVFSWLTVHTWRQLWRKGEDRWGRLVFDRGVRQCGMWSWVGFSVLFPPAVGSNLDARLFFFAWAVFSFPIWLWAGYGWGITMAAVLGIQRPAVKP